MQTSREIKNVFQKYNLKPLKKLGQNFLIDKNVLKKIIEAADLSPQDIVLEIGPGLGILTLELAKRAEKVIAIEKDKNMCGILSEMLDVRNVRNVEIINKDILRFNPYTLYPTPYTLIANLPYYITSPVIRKFLETENPPKEMVLMVQKEVAQRICAKPPHMNMLAVSVQFYAIPKIISYVSKNSFWPQPKVDSAIIKITPTSKKSEMLFLRLQGGVIFQLVKAGFSSKRKQLINSLSKGLNLNKETTKNLLNKAKINPNARAENLTIENWLKLYENYKK